MQHVDNYIYFLVFRFRLERRAWLEAWQQGFCAMIPGFFSRLSGFFSGANAPVHEVMRRNEEACAELDQSAPLTDQDFVVLDTELSAMDLRAGEILSIGAVRIRDLTLRPGERFSSLVRPHKAMATGATLIHRLTPESLENAPALEEVLPAFVDWCGGAVLVGHYLDLDMGFLNREAARLLGRGMANPCIDTLRMAQAYEEKRDHAYLGAHLDTLSYALSALAARHGLPDFPRHDALADAMQTAYLFLFLVRKLRGGRIGTLKDLWEAQRARVGWG